MTGPGSGDRDFAETDFHELYEHAPCALLSTLPDGTIVRANATFFEWIGSEPAAIVDRRRFQSLLTIGAQMYYETHYAPLLQIQGAVAEIALEIRRADGSIRPVVASARQVRAAGGEVAFHRIALFDSSDRRRYELELLKARQRAEASARLLEQADRRKTEFIATLAHELRNPLAPIRNALELSRRSGDEPITGPALQMMHRQVGQLLRLVEDLFDASRLGEDKLRLRLGPVDLGSVVRHASEMSAPMLESAGVSYTVGLPPSSVYVEGDAARLTQVIGNILNNAAKFTPAGGSVTLTLHQEGNEATIRVSDTGVGLDASQLTRVFDMFMQADAGAEHRVGLGIGLALAREFVVRHGGRIAARSDGIGRGAEFSVALPALTEPPQAVVRTLEQDRPARPASPRRVLVVDDNRDAAGVIAMLLELDGHDTRQAHDGPAALRVASEFHPHVVLLDIGLPILSGYEVAAHIRAEASVQPVLVALTGWGQEQDRRKAERAGFDAHLVKPVDHSVLSRLIADTGEPA